MSEEEKMTQFKEGLAEDHLRKRRKAAVAKREELKQEIAIVSEPKGKNFCSET